MPAGRRLRPAERVRLGCEIVRAYGHARRELRRTSITAAVAALRARPPVLPATAASGGLSEARRLGRAVARTLALLPGDTRCLTRSLVLTRLMARRGIAGTLVIGARAAPEFAAHAWVEHEGHAVLAQGDGSFARLVEL